MMNEKGGAVIVSTVVTLGFILLLSLLVLKPLPAGDTTDKLLIAMVGVLAAQFSAVVQFWLGSSIGSKNKDQINANLVAQVTSRS